MFTKIMLWVHNFGRLEAGRFVPNAFSLNGTCKCVQKWFAGFTWFLVWVIDSYLTNWHTGKALNSHVYESAISTHLQPVTLTHTELYLLPNAFCVSCKLTFLAAGYYFALGRWFFNRLVTWWTDIQLIMHSGVTSIAFLLRPVSI